MKKQLVIFVLVSLMNTFVFSVSPVPSNCSDNFSWMATSTTSPNDSPCTTWVPDSFWSQAELASGGWSYHIPNSTTATSSFLQIGDGGHQFVVNSRSVSYLQANWSLEQKRVGFIIEVSFNTGDSWNEITTSGATLTPAYNYGMVAGPLAGSLAYSGTLSTKIKIDLRGANPGNALLQIHFGGTGCSAGTAGLWITGFESWSALLDEPEVDIFADSDNIYPDVKTGNDPRVVGTKIWLNEIFIGQTPSYTLPPQINVTNGESYTITAQNVDAIGNVSPLASSCTITPEDTGAPGMTSIRLTREPTNIKIYWSGDPGVSGYRGYRLTSPQEELSPSNQIGSGNTDTRVFRDYDPDVRSNSTLYFYLVIGVDSGETPEPRPEQVQLCPILN